MYVGPKMVPTTYCEVLKALYGTVGVLKLFSNGLSAFLLDELKLAQPV